MEAHTSEEVKVKHVVTSNGMGYFWCSCSPNIARVLWSVNEHIAEIAVEADAAGFQRGVEKLDGLRRAQVAHCICSEPSIYVGADGGSWCDSCDMPVLRIRNEKEGI
jgi:hypothetical protein